MSACIRLTPGDAAPASSVQAHGIDLTVTASDGIALDATAIAGSVTFDPNGDGNRTSVTVDVVAG